MELEKHLEKIRGLQITIQVVTLKIISYRTRWKKGKKEKVKIIFSMDKTNNLLKGYPCAPHKIWSKILPHRSL